MQVKFEEIETTYLKNVMKMLYNDKEDTLKLHELNSPLLVHMYWKENKYFSNYHYQASPLSGSGKD